MLSLKNIHIEFSGPIEKIEINLKFSDDGNPKPLILVGENGTGKTTLISFIVDSFLEFSAEKYNDVLITKSNGRLYYRVRINDVRIGSNYAVSHLTYELNSTKKIHYVDRIGKEGLAELHQRLNLPANMQFNPELNAEKLVSENDGQASEEIKNNVFLFFPSGRKEVPHWFQDESLPPTPYSQNKKFNNVFGKPIVIDSAVSEISTWIMDGLIDNAIGYENAGIHAANEILRIILRDTNAHFAVAPRNISPRVQIYTIKDGVRQICIPSLDHLSSGQSMLLSMFGSIVNHGTLWSIVPMNSISGIVVVDEAEVYLHTSLQRAVLPKLIKLFPKVQFILTSHSPSFLIGMQEEFGNDGFQLVNMPTGTPINVDQFTEIGAAVETLRETTAFRTELKNKMKEEDNGPLLIVEGRSDAIFIENLWNLKYGENPPFKIIQAKGKRALRYLLNDEEFLDEVNESQKVLGLFDFDEAFDDWNKIFPIEMGDDLSGLLLKHSSKEIYAGLLPIPPSRSAQAGKKFSAKSHFTIELYLPDEVLASSNNLDHEILPGDFKISKFKGNKVAFAQNNSIKPEQLVYFTNLLNLLERILI